MKIHNSARSEIHAMLESAKLLMLAGDAKGAVRLIEEIIELSTPSEVGSA